MCYKKHFVVIIDFFVVQHLLCALGLRRASNEQSTRKDACTVCSVICWWTAHSFKDLMLSPLKVKPAAKWYLTIQAPSVLEFNQLFVWGEFLFYMKHIFTKWRILQRSRSRGKKLIPRWSTFDSMVYEWLRKILYFKCDRTVNGAWVLRGGIKG